MNKEKDRTKGLEREEALLRQSAQLTLFEEKSITETILNSISDAISIQALNYRILFQNKAHKDLLGDHTGEFCYEAYNQRDSVCHSCPVEMAFKDGQSHTVQKGGLEKYKGVYVEITASPLRNIKGEVIAGIEVVRNITEQRKAEEALRSAEAKFRGLVEQSLVGIYIIQDGRFLYVNPKLAEIFGYTQDEIISSKTVTDLTAEADCALVLENIHKRLSGEVQSIHYSFKGQRKDGTLIDVEVHGSRADYDGRPVIIGTLLDVTGRKNIEEELQRAQKLESLGTLAGGIAHDFNNILIAITGNISLAKMYAKPGLEIFDILTEAERAAAKAKNLTSQLLTFSKGGAPVKKITSITKLIKDSANFALSGSNVRCVFNIPDDIWPVEVDDVQINQVIHNLIINGQQAMPEGGIITIQIENAVIAPENLFGLKGGKYIVISVKDEGLGIPEEHLQKIFDPYFTTKQEGSGLGLATAYSIVKKHDGHIAAASKLGAGTTFHVYLPASEVKATVIRDAGKVPLVGRDKGRVLVMDDDEIVRIVVGRMLNQCGYEAEFSEDGTTAIELYKKAKESGRPFDAVILDLVIPAGMGGKETIKRLLEIDPDVKAIVSSGYSDDSVIANFREYGFKGALPKPYELAVLNQTLTEVISGS